jgi:hypothetical protein
LGAIPCFPCQEVCVGISTNTWRAASAVADCSVGALVVETEGHTGVGAAKDSPKREPREISDELVAAHILENLE